MRRPCRELRHDADSALLESECGGTARFASELIGQRDVIQTVTSKSKVNKHFFPDEASSQRHATEFAVLPSEIEQLPDLMGYLKFASSPSWSEVLVPSRSSP
jgi:hypothetical protein